MSELIGLVVNPKLRKPVLVEHDDGDVSIFRWEDFGDEWRLQREGKGYFEASTDPPYGTAAELSGYPRAHTPHGVKSRGSGYGTSLYTALCVAANQDDDGDLRLHLDVSGAGISSQEGTRSPSAEAWWSRAKRFGLAQEMNDEFTREYVDLSHVDEDALLSCLESDLESGERVSHINQFEVDLTRYVDYDVYTFDAADRAGLVLASFTFDGTPSAKGTYELYQAVVEGDLDLHYVDEEAMAALDVRGLPPGIVETMAVILDQEGSSRVANEMRLKHVLGLDPAMGSAAAKKVLKPNARDARDAERALQATAAARKKLKWSTWAKLP